MKNRIHVFSATDSSVFDFEALRDRMGDEEIARLAIQAFLNALPDLMDAVRSAGVGGNARSLYESIHKLKGSALNISGEALAQKALELERRAAAGEYAVDLIPAILDECRLLDRALREAACA